MLHSLDFLEEKRDQAIIKVTAYQEKEARYYNARVRIQRFWIRDLILKNVLPNSQELRVNILGPNWERPYRIKKVVRLGTYILYTLSGKILGHAWNAKHLKIYDNSIKWELSWHF